MNKRLLIPFAMFAFTLMFIAAPAISQTPSPTPSTNDDNRDNGWAHFNVIDDSVTGQVEVEFVSTRDQLSCFEYRSDGDTTEQTSITNFNPAISDGLYPFKCERNSTSQLTLSADEYVEIRLVFGAEADERFDWTRIEVTQLATPAPSPTLTPAEPTPAATPSGPAATPRGSMATQSESSSNDPETKDDCKNGGWKEYGFKNQGQCNRFVSTGFDSREKP